GAEDPVRVRVLLEDAQHDLVRGPAGGSYGSHAAILLATAWI
ncbi:MAG: hypothetical protein QOG29_692, partial [Gaiellaceae bacterium]|nr:hypothetical protein [Gaiellaceae bacterium]